ncbi:Hypothetical predicted protein [Pelobates cultripes]|uniref:Uncharacterized protein n=1 Tax=Pelobates cultripes TaxID=61616 RepID=A0AAD1WRA7_PELCU|nr:Hypothetical predicted protein [Pelobates cultripes]
MATRLRDTLTTIPSPLTSLTHNPKIAGGLPPKDVAELGGSDWTYMKQLCSATKLKPLLELAPDGTPSHMGRFGYHQIQHYYQSITGSLPSLNGNAHQETDP